jgi:hydroxymethylbilane synthase
MRLRLGTRGSALALAQSQLVADAVSAASGVPVDLVEIVTPGDRSAAPVQHLGVGVFVSALRDALLAKEIDFAVHSYKDLPTAPAEELVIAAIPPREDPRDVLVARDGLRLSELPPSSVVGTGAIRRLAQLKALGLGLTTAPIRGNVDSRLRRVASGELDAVVLARAGLARLGRLDEATESLDPGLMLPAPAQGALAVECRVDSDLAEVLRVLDDAASRAAVTAERSLLAALEAGCSAPVAGLASVTPTEINLRGAVFSEDGRHAIRMSRTGPIADADGIGRQLAADLLGAGADRLFTPPGAVPVPGQADQNEAVPGSAQ